MTYKTLTKLAKGRSPAPILGYVRAKDGIATTTDLDVYIHQPIINKLDNSLYNATGFDKEIFVKDETPVEDFPELGCKGDVIGVANITADLMDAFKWVLLAANNDKTRYYLNGIYFDKEGVIVATDGYRLHSFKNDINWKSGGGAVLPTKACKIIIDLMKETKAESFRIQFHNNCKFTCNIGDIIVEGKLIDCTFPDWRNLLPDYPEENSTVFDPAQIKAILPTLKNILKISNSKTPILVIENCVAKTPDSYSVNYEWNVIMNIPFSVGFKAKQLSELCGGVMRYSDKSSPFIVKGRRGLNEYTAVIMPMRV